MNFVLKNIGSGDSRWKNDFGNFTQCLILQNENNGETRCVAHFVGEWAKRDAGQLLSALNSEPESKIKARKLVVTNIAEKFGAKERTIFMSLENETNESVYILLTPKFTYSDGMFQQIFADTSAFSATIWNDAIMQTRNYVPFSNKFLLQP